MKIKNRMIVIPTPRNVSSSKTMFQPEPLKQDTLDEKVLSAIVEIRVTVDRTEEIIHLVHQVEKNIDSVVAPGVGTGCDENGEEPIVAPVLNVWDTVSRG